MPAIFNVAWASVQVAHLSIVNSLTYGQRRRDMLINRRNAFTYIANVSILTMALFIFMFVPNQNTQFRILAFAAVGLGCCTSAFYILTIKEVPLS